MNDKCTAHNAVPFYSIEVIHFKYLGTVITNGYDIGVEIGNEVPDRKYFLFVLGTSFYASDCCASVQNKH